MDVEDRVVTFYIDIYIVAVFYRLGTCILMSCIKVWNVIVTIIKALINLSINRWANCIWWWWWWSLFLIHYYCSTKLINIPRFTHIIIIVDIISLHIHHHHFLMLHNFINFCHWRVYTELVFRLELVWGGVDVLWWCYAVDILCLYVVVVINVGWWLYYGLMDREGLVHWHVDWLMIVVVYLLM